MKRKSREEVEPAEHSVSNRTAHVGAEKIVSTLQGVAVLVRSDYSFSPRKLMILTNQFECDQFLICTGFVRGLQNLKSFGNLNLLVPGLEVLEIWENPIKSHGYWHFHNEPNVYIALPVILFFSPQLLGPSLPTSWESLCTQFMVEVDSTKVLNKPVHARSNCDL
jgi:hypothetical protein